MSTSMDKNTLSSWKNILNEKEFNQDQRYISGQMRAWVETVAKFRLHDYQVKFLLDCIFNDRVLGVFCRQTGKTTTIALYALWYAIHMKNRTVLIIAPTDRQAGEMFSRIRQFALQCNLVEPHIESHTQREMVFNNGSIIRALPTGDEGNTIRGQTAHLVILEEAGFMKDQIVNRVIMPMIAATNGRVIMIGTPWMKNFFYEAHLNERYAVHQYDWTIAVESDQLKQEFIDEQREVLSGIEFATEYEAKFIEDSDAYFPRDLILSCVSDIETINEPREHGIYTLGVDFARLGSDSSVFITAEQHRLTGMISIVNITETKQKLLTDSIGRVQMLHERFKYRRIVLDETGLGAGPTDVLKEKLPGMIEGLTFTQRSKMDLYSNLKSWMEKGLVRIPNNKKLLYQLLDLRYELSSNGRMKIHHSERGHDDYCDGLCLAVWPLKHKKERTWTVAGA